MKEILAIMLLLTMVNAEFWNNYNRGFGHPPWGRGPPFQEFPGHRHGWHYPHRGWFSHHREHKWEDDDIGFINAEWICRNPKTGDKMIITGENSKMPDHSQGWPGWSNTGDDKENIPDHIPITQESPKQTTQSTTKIPKPSPTTEEVNQPDTGIPTSIPGQSDTVTTNNPRNGEGLIDIRFGQF